MNEVECRSASGNFRDLIEQAFGGIVAHDAADFGAVGVEDEHGGEGIDAKLFGHGRSLSLFHVDLEIDETGIEHFATSGCGKTSRASFLQGPHQLV